MLFVVHGARAWFAMRGADAMTILGDLYGCPVKVPQLSNETGDHAGFTHTSGMSAHNDNRHIYFDSFFASRASTDNCFRCSRIGRAGVPQNTIPFPRRTLFEGIPAWAPRITPSPIMTWSAIPTCPPTIAFAPTLELPEIPV